MRYGYRLLVACLLLSPASHVVAEPAASKPDAFRLRLERSVPTLLTHLAALESKLSTRDLQRMPASVHGRVGVQGIAGLLLPNGPANRPSVVDLRLSHGPPIPPPPPGTVTPRVVAATGPFVERLLWNDDVVFGSVAGAKPEVYDGPFPHGFLAKVEPGRAADLPIELPDRGPVAGSAISIRVTLAPTHEGLVQLSLSWGSWTLAPVAAVRGAGASTVSFHGVASGLPEKGTPLVLSDATASMPPTTPDDTSDDRGAIWIDSVEVRALMPKTDAVLAEIEPEVFVRLSVSFATRAVPHFDAPDPVAAAKGADEVILTTTATAAGAARLAAHRSASGVKAVGIPFADVVDRLGYGTCDPEIVGRYLSKLAAHGTTPRFLLLAGDAMRDVVDDPATSIPTAYGRTMYNGATASDRLFVRAGLEKGVKPPSVGRLPFRDSATMDAYVDRVIAYETKPPADATRRLVRFVTSEGRFGPVIDTLLQNLFENIVSEEIPKAYDVEVTFASANSAYCWPPSRFHEKVIGGLNEGALFYTYVGHGWAEGFDSLHVGKQRYPILRSADVPQVNITGTPPAMFVVACTTATFDDPDQTGVGELLIARPHGPLAYWGATRVCHPAWNSFVGRQIAMTIFDDPNRRIGEVLDAAVAAVLTPDPADKGRKLIELGAKALTPGSVPLERILEEGAWMYALLGDPAVRIALTKENLAVTATSSGDAAVGVLGVKVSVRGPFPDGTEVQMSIEVPRNVRIGREAPKGLSPDDAQRARHASSNDKALGRATATAKGEVAEATLSVPAEWSGRTLIAKAWCISGGDVHQGAALVTPGK